MGKKSKPVTSSTGVPKWLEGYYQDIASQAKAQNQQAYPEYDINARLADQSSQTLQSLNFLEDTAFNQIGAYDKGMSIFDNLAGQSGLDQYQNYVNPYLNDVLGAARSNLQDQSARDSAALAANKGMAGSFGGSRFAVAEDLQRQTNLDKLNELEVSQRSAAYDNGWNKYLQDYSNQAGGAMNLMQGAGQTMQGYQASAAQLGQVGLNTDIREQSLADMTYQDFMDRQNWNRSKLADYANLVYGQGSTFGTTTQSGGGPSGASQAVGAIGTAASVAAMFM